MKPSPMFANGWLISACCGPRLEGGFIHLGVPAAQAIGDKAHLQCSFGPGVHAQGEPEFLH